MRRDCPHCHKALTPRELSREQSRRMEAERKAAGLQGILFRYYTCSECGHADIFVDVHPLEGETDEAFQQRKQELEEAVRELHAEAADVVLVERGPGAPGRG